MAFRDGTGPWGQGPLSGRGFGPCGFGRGFGYGIRFCGGWGRGYTRGRFGPGYRAYGPAYDSESVGTEFSSEGIGSLEDYKDALKKELAWVEKELKND